MRDPDLIFGRIDRVLHECDARQLPPLVEIEQPDGTWQHIDGITNTTLNDQPATPPADPVLEATTRRWFRWPWSRR